MMIGSRKAKSLTFHEYKIDISRNRRQAESASVIRRTAMTQIARSTVFIGFDTLCRAYGVNPHQLLLECGLDPLVLRRSDLHVPYARFAQALSLAAAEGNCPTFGLQLSEYHDYLVFGPFGLLLSQADSFSEALKMTQQYVHLHAQGITLIKREEHEHLEVEYRLQLSEMVDLRQLLELGL